jgi:plasmid maintenance system antidote protein VapI
MTPTRITPPYRILARELKARNWTPKQLAKRSGIDPIVVLALLSGVTIKPRHAIALAKAFGTSEEFWLNLIRNYERHKWLGGDRPSTAQPKT